jgi:hypothetical protein
MHPHTHTQVSETEQYLWTSTIGNIICFKHTRGKPDLELVDSYDRGYNFRFHGEGGREWCVFGGGGGGLLRRAWVL